jgi:hypothetical protein
LGHIASARGADGTAGTNRTGSAEAVVNKMSGDQQNATTDGDRSLSVAGENLVPKKCSNRHQNETGEEGHKYSTPAMDAVAGPEGEKSDKRDRNSQRAVSYVIPRQIVQDSRSEGDQHRERQTMKQTEH